jgi:hypothetical protein
MMLKINTSETREGWRFALAGKMLTTFAMLKRANEKKPREMFKVKKD